MRHLLAAALALSGCVIPAGPDVPRLSVCDHGERSFTVYDGETGYYYDWNADEGRVRVTADKSQPPIGYYGPVWSCEEARDWVHAQAVAVRM